MKLPYFDRQTLPPVLCKHWIFLTTAILSSFLCVAQKEGRYHAFAYGVNEGLLQTTIGDIAIDRNNYCWISFPNGIQKFDGKTFVRIPVQPGLPYDKQTHLRRTGQGDLLISHTGGVSLYDIETNSFRLILGHEAGAAAPFYFLGETGGVFYLLDGKFSVLGFDLRTWRLLSRKPGFIALPPGAQSQPVVSNVSRGCVSVAFANHLYLWDLSQQRLVGQFTVPRPTLPYGLLYLQGSRLHFNTTAEGTPLWVYDFKKAELSPHPAASYAAGANRFNAVPWGKALLFSAGLRLFAADSALGIAGELLNFQNLPFTPSSEFAKVASDGFGNLYLSTVRSGLVKIIANHYSIRYFASGPANDRNVVSLLPDKSSGRVLVGTTGGLFVFDTNGRVMHRIRTLPGGNSTFVCNAITLDNEGHYLLSVSTGARSIYCLHRDLSSLKLLRSTDRSTLHGGYFGNFLYKNDSVVWLQSQAILYRIRTAYNDYNSHSFSTGYVHSGFFYKGKIISHATDELLLLSGPDFREQRKISFPGTGDVRCYAADKKGRIYLGSNNGIYIIDEGGKILEHHTSATGLPDDCIYAMTFDEEGLLWCSSNKGLFRLNGDGTFLQLTKDDGLQENEFNTGVVAVATDGELFFGGINGISSFYPASIRQHREALQVFFTSITAVGKPASAKGPAWTLSEIVLPHDRASLVFDFVAMGNGNPDHYIYQYRMKGLEEAWVSADGLQTLRYSLLPGRYRLQLYASRTFDKDALPMRELVVVILPPFWQTLWFTIAALVLFAAVVGGTIYRYSKGKYKKQLAAIEAERRLQAERERISRDLHDNLGAYANAVLYNLELMEADPNPALPRKTMADLKFASKDIITSLRETVWALKKETYTAEACLLRIRNFVQSLSRYYPQIHFEVKGEAPPDKVLQHRAALNAVRITQELLTNAIKHSGASRIGVETGFVDNTWTLRIWDNGKGFDAEAQELQALGNGLAHMRKRAAESQFTLHIRSSVDEGTEVAVAIP